MLPAGIFATRNDAINAVAARSENSETWRHRGKGIDALQDAATSVLYPPKKTT
jgi:hypothetical protein